MKKVISRPGAKLVLTGEGIELRRGIFGGQRKFLSWNDVAAVGFFVDDMVHTAFDFNSYATSGATGVPPLMAKKYDSYDLFIYFSVFKPRGFGMDNILPVFREERNICLNLGGGGYFAARSIKKIADRTAQTVAIFYGGDIINRAAVYHE